MQRQFDLLERVPLREAPPLQAARSAGEDAGEKCLAKAEDVAKFSAREAALFIHSWVVRYGPTPGEQLVKAAREHGHAPHDDRAFGPVFPMLLRGVDGKRLKVLRSDLPRERGHGTSGGKLYGVVR